MEVSRNDGALKWEFVLIGNEIPLVRLQNGETHESHDAIYAPVAFSADPDEALGMVVGSQHPALSSAQRQSEMLQAFYGGTGLKMEVAKDLAGHRTFTQVLRLELPSDRNYRIAARGAGEK